MILQDRKEQQPTLLLVDDSVENLHVLSALLQSEYDLRVAKSGGKALEFLERNVLPDLILLDVMMPDVDGYEVCRRIKANARTAKIPVLFLTALNESIHETQALRCGAADFITKPFNPDVVKARISVHLSLQNERKKSEVLLQVLLPDNVIKDLIEKGHHTPTIVNNVSVLFLDFVGFTKMTTQMAPNELIQELSEVFGRFDEICEENGVTRIKTIGDAYMAVSGLTKADPMHATTLSKVALEFIRYLNMRNAGRGRQWNCRIGIHSGSVIAGIIGKTRFLFDVLGDDVNIAARVEGCGSPMMVTVSQTTADLIRETFRTSSIGIHELDGKGEYELFTIEGSVGEF